MEQQLREYLRETVREGGKKASRRDDLLAGRAPGEEKYAERVPDLQRLSAVWDRH